MVISGFLVCYGNIDLVPFAVFIVNLFWSHYSSMFFTPLFKLCSTSASVVLIPFVYSVASSAYTSFYEVLVTGSRSFINMLNKNGPSMEPCGTHMYPSGYMSEIRVIVV